MIACETVFRRNQFRFVVNCSRKPSCPFLTISTTSQEREFLLPPLLTSVDTWPLSWNQRQHWTISEIHHGSWWSDNWRKDCDCSPGSTFRSWFLSFLWYVLVRMYSKDWILIQSQSTQVPSKSIRQMCCIVLVVRDGNRISETQHRKYNTLDIYTKRTTSSLSSTVYCAMTRKDLLVQEWFSDAWLPLLATIAGQQERHTILSAQEPRPSTCV